MKKAILILTILIFTSCSSKVILQGQEVRVKNQIPKREVPVYIMSFIAGFAVVNHIK